MATCVSFIICGMAANVSLNCSRSFGSSIISLARSAAFWIDTSVLSAWTITFPMRSSFVSSNSRIFREAAPNSSLVLPTDSMASVSWPCRLAITCTGSFCSIPRMVSPSVINVSGLSGSDERTNCSEESPSSVALTRQISLCRSRRSLSISRLTCT